MTERSCRFWTSLRHFVPRPHRDPDRKLIDHRLDIIDVANNPFQFFRLGRRTDAPLQPDPAPLAVDPDTRALEPAVRVNCLYDTRNDLAVVQVCVRQSAAPGKVATDAAL